MNHLKQRPSIRPAVKDDIDLIITIARATWPIAYKDILDPRALNYMLNHIYSPAALGSQMDNGQQFFIADLAGQSLGFASIGELENHNWKLHKLYVLPEYQKTGAGAALLLHVVDFVRAKGAAELLLNVNRYNPAQKFYQRFGFVIIRDEDVDLGEGVVQEDYVMRLLLSNTPAGGSA